MFYLHFSVFLLISATNLLTRCQSGQFLFSTVFGFRITGNQICSELEKETILRSFTPEDSRSPKGSSRGGTGGPHLAQARPSLAGRSWPRCGPPRPPPTPPFRLFIHPRRENPKYSEKIPERIP